MAEFNSRPPPPNGNRNQTAVLVDYAARLQRMIVNHRRQGEEAERIARAEREYDDQARAGRLRVENRRAELLRLAGDEVPQFLLTRQMYGNHLQEFTMNNMHNGHPIFMGDLPTMMRILEPRVQREVARVFEEIGSIKFLISGFIVLSKGNENVNGDLETLRMPINSGLVEVLNAASIHGAVASRIQKILGDVENAYLKGSGWNYMYTDKIKLEFSRYVIRGGAAYRPSSKFVRDKNATVNPQNHDDNMCFKWAITIGLNHVANTRNPGRITRELRQQAEALNWEDIAFPVGMNAIDTFEENNEDVAVHILTYEPMYLANGQQSGRFLHARVSSKPRQRAEEGKQTRIVVLLLEGDFETGHYVWVKDYAALISAQVNKVKEGLIYCMQCLNFSCERTAAHRLIEHHKHCQANEGVVEIMPKEGDVIEYLAKDHKKKIRLPFVIKCDFESLTTKVQKQGCGSTKKYQKHVASEYCLKVVTQYPEIQRRYPVEHYNGEDVMPRFIRRLFELQKDLYDNYIKSDVGMRWNEAMMTKIWEEQTTTNLCCHICEQPFAEGDMRVLDHDHINGEYRGLAHQVCNLNYNLDKSFIPVLAHNMKGYDSKFIVRELAKHSDNIKVIAQSGEKFISFGTYHLRFLDSFQFMSCSLDTLVFNLTGRKKDEDYITLTEDMETNAVPRFRYLNELHDRSKVYRITKPLNKIALEGIYPFRYEDIHGVPNRKALFTIVKGENGVADGSGVRAPLTDAQYARVLELWDSQPIIVDNPVNFLTMKGVFMYDFVDDRLVFDYPCLPYKKEFYSQLRDEDVSSKDYARAQLVWEIFGCETIRDYQSLYIKCDTLQLCDVFDNFRTACIEDSGIDPCWSYTLPGYSWLAMLKKTAVKIGLVFDSDMLRMIENNIRGGICIIPKRYAKANNPKCKGYDPSKPTSWILTVDANNLYGWAMVQHLPVDGGKWVDTATFVDGDGKFKNDIILQLADDAEHCYFLEVDLLIPRELHDKFNDYPLAVENAVPNPEDYSPLQARMANEMNASKPTRKLLGTLAPKTKYLVHSRMLKFYIEQGVRVTKVHRVSEFQQAPWLKPYIDGNTRKRAACGKNKFLRDLYKLLNNSMFGKTMERVREHQDIRLISSGGRDPAKQQRRYNKLTSSPFCKGHRVIAEDELSIVHMRQSTVKLNKSVQVGFAVLELSKLLMAKFHYEVMQQKYGVDKLKLLFSDTDSMTYEILTEDLDADLATMQEHFDFANLPEDHPLFNNANKDVVGLFKNEAEGYYVSEFCGLRAKMYSMEFQDGDKIKFKKTAKGIGKAAAKKISHQRYKDCVQQNIHIVQDGLGQVFVTDHRKQFDEMTAFRSFDFHIFSVLICKISLSCFDDKRFICDDGFSTLAYGHWRIPA